MLHWISAVSCPLIGWAVSMHLQSTDQIKVKFCDATNYGPPTAWLTFGLASLNFSSFQTSDWLSSFHVFADKPLIGLSLNLVGQLIMGLPCPDWLLGMFHWTTGCPPVTQVSILSLEFVSCHLQNLLHLGWLWVLMCLHIIDTVFTRGQFWPSGIYCRCLCLCISLSVCMCVQSQACLHHNSSPVLASTTKLGSDIKNTLLFGRVINLDFQGQI